MSQTYLNEFAERIVKDVEIDSASDEKFVGWETIATILVFQGIPIILPELKEWVKLGMAAVALKRLEIEKKLIDLATEKELDYELAKKTATKVSDNITKDNVKKLISSIEDSESNEDKN
ncbi:MAG: hypothetical protein CMO01_31105 [Thalassobius sp.]|nr:hypothetical protein [Thalassovita sp.]